MSIPSKVDSVEDYKINAQGKTKMFTYDYMRLAKQELGKKFQICGYMTHDSTVLYLRK